MRGKNLPLLNTLKNMCRLTLVGKFGGSRHSRVVSVALNLICCNYENNIRTTGSERTGSTYHYIAVRSKLRALVWLPRWPRNSLIFSSSQIYRTLPLKFGLSALLAEHDVSVRLKLESRCGSLPLKY